MANFRTIQYAIELDTGLIISKVRDQLLIPVLDFENMKPENNFQTNYDLQVFPLNTLVGIWHCYKWTKKIPKEIKNLHRIAWGMKPLK